MITIKVPEYYGKGTCNRWELGTKKYRNGKKIMHNAYRGRKDSSYIRVARRKGRGTFIK